MNLRQTFFLTCALTFLTIHSAGAAEDMELEAPDGKIFLLHDDNTWDLAKQQRGKYLIEHDEPIALSDNRILLVSADGSWRFITKADLPKPKPSKLNRAVGEGYGESRDVAVAKKKALDKAASKTARKIYTSLKKKDVSLSQITGCVRRCHDYLDIAENFRQNTGWQVTARFDLDGDMVHTVVECAKEAGAKGQ